MIELSIIIINENNSNKLQACLKSLINNKFPKNKYEIIVVDNGSTDNSRTMLNRISSQNHQIKIITQKKQGFSVARNKAINESQSEVIIFLSSEAICKKNFLEQHYKFHQENINLNTFCLGISSFKTETQLNKWFMTKSNLFEKYIGSYFNLSAFQNLSEIELYYASLNNLSCKTKTIKKYLFNPWFDLNNGENIEIFYRIQNKSSLNLILNQEISVELNSTIKLNDFSHYLVIQGQAYAQLTQKYPLEFPSIKQSSKRLAKLFTNNISLRFIKYINSNFYFYSLTIKYFLLGLNKVNNLK